MKVLIDHNEPFAFAPGGLKVQIEQTLSGLQQIGIEARPFRWWEAKQDAEILHYFGIPHSSYVARAQAQGLKVVITQLLTHTCNRSRLHLGAQALVTQGLLRIPAARVVCDRMGWLALRAADAVVCGLKAEAAIFRRVWGIRPERINIIPLGLLEAFLESPSGQPHFSFLPDRPFLINVGTICRRKYSLELARLAQQARVPILFVGKSLPEDASYWQNFRDLFQFSYVWHHPYNEDAQTLAALYAAAQGFVHFSDGENWCLAAHEAAACGLPLLLRDQPWSRECFGGSATYWTSENFSADSLKTFFLNTSKPCAHPQSTLVSWVSVATQLRNLYARLLSQSRPYSEAAN